MAKKEKDPAFLLYTKDWLTGTFFMTYEQKGKFIDLICLQHQNGHLTTEQLGKILDDTDVELFSKFIRDEEGKWYNPRTDREIEKRVKYSEYQAELANRRWNKDANASVNKDANNDAMASANKDTKTKPKEYPRTENESINGKSNSTIVSSTQTLFTQEDPTPVFNSLDDLYNDLP